MNSIKKFLRSGAGVLSANYRVVTGTGICSEKPFTLLWSGPKSQLAYFCTRVFATTNLSTRRVGRHAAFTLDGLLQRYECDMAAIILNRTLAEMIKRPSDLLVPLWVRCVVELGDEKAYTKSESMRGDLRNIRKNELTWKVSGQASAFQHFYDNYYLPTVMASHGASVIPANKTQRLELLDSGQMELLQVLRNDEVVAGLSIDYRGETPEFRDSGVLDGSVDLKKAGAVTATYLFAMDYLTSKSHSRVGFGHSRGFLDDGVLSYKRKFRPKILPGPDECILLRAPILNEVIRTVLCSNSCLTWENGELFRTYFTDPTSDPSGKYLRKQRNSWPYGIKREKIFDISGKDLQSLS
jgi:hypothetical protein